MEWGVTGERKPNCLCRLQRQTLSSLYSPRPEHWHYEIATDWSPPVAQEACSHSCFLRQVELKFWDLGFAGCANRLHCSIVSPTMGVHTSTLIGAHNATAHQVRISHQLTLFCHVPSSVWMKCMILLNLGQSKTYMPKLISTRRYVCHLIDVTLAVEHALALVPMGMIIGLDVFPK